MFRVVLDERKRREIDPTLSMLRECIAEAAQQKEKDPHTQERLQALCEFFESTTAWYVQVRKWPAAALARFVKLGDKALKVLSLSR
jgi:DNA-binding transcriptional regulator GbsR (MarR family)